MGYSSNCPRTIDGLDVGWAPGEDEEASHRLSLSSFSICARPPRASLIPGSAKADGEAIQVRRRNDLLQDGEQGCALREKLGHSVDVGNLGGLCETERKTRTRARA